MRPPIAIFTYPFVDSNPPFPFTAGPPIDHASGKITTIAPYLRSANNLSYTRTLELLRRELGPHYPLEKLWDMHTYYVGILVRTKGAPQIILTILHRNLQKGMP